MTTKRDGQLIAQLVLDCDIYNFREKDALEYIKTRLGRKISDRTYRRYKARMLDGNLTRDWMNYFTRTGFLVQHHQLFSCARHLLESSMNRLFEEENKEMPDDNLMLHLRQDVRDNMKVVSELSAGPAIISQLDSRIQELQEKVAQKELMQPEYNVLSSR
jgi:hypothetical protein